AAQATVAGVHHLRRRAACRAEPVPTMPIDHRLRLSDDGSVLDRYERRRHPRVAKIAASCERTGLCGVIGERYIQREDRAIVIKAEEDTGRAVTRDQVRDFRRQQAELERRS